MYRITRRLQRRVSTKFSTLQLRRLFILEIEGMEKHHQPKKQNAVRRTHVVADVVFVVVIAVVVAVAVFTLTHHQKSSPLSLHER